MARDVEAELLRIFAEQGALTEESARACWSAVRHPLTVSITRLRAEKRYLLELYKRG